MLGINSILGAALLVVVRGLTQRSAITEAHESLEREGPGEQDSIREEVDAFLAKQVFQVRHEPDLSVTHRESIVGRRRRAIGRITPNGTSFHAWKKLVAVSWLRRKAAAALALGALAIGVGACGKAPDEDRGPGSSEPVASAPSTPGTIYDTTYEVAKPTISKDAADAFGAKEAAAGTEMASGIAQEWGFNEKAIVSQVEDPAAVKYVMSAGDDMTPSLQKEWVGNVNEYVRAARSGGPVPQDVASSVLTYTYFDAFREADEGWTVTATGPVVVNQKISKVTTTPTSDGRLAVKVASQADFRVSNKGKPKLWAFSRETSYYLSQTPEGWKVSAWHTSWTTGEFRPDKAV